MAARCCCHCRRCFPATEKKLPAAFAAAAAAAPPTVLLPAACGLYYLAELCEEYIITTKRIIGHVIKVGGWMGGGCSMRRAGAR